MRGQDGRERRRGRLPAVALGLSVFLALGAAGARAGELGDVFREGNALYAEGKYDEAAQRFERIVKHGIENAAVRFNLGNCRYKRDRLAEALVEYEKAARLDPADADIRDNIALVRSRLGLKKESLAPWILRKLGAFLHLLPLRSALWVALGSFLALNVFAAVWILRGWRGGGTGAGLVRGGMRAAAAVLGAIFLWSAAASASLAYRREARREGIVIEAEAPVRSAPSDDGAVLFTIPLGYKARIQSRSGEWAHVSLESGWHGWVRLGAIAEI